MGNHPNKPQTVAEAKQQFRVVTESRKPDFLERIKERPIESVGIAFMAGMMLNKSTKSGLPVGLLSVGLQLLKKL